MSSGKPSDPLMESDNGVRQERFFGPVPERTNGEELVGYTTRFETWVGSAAAIIVSHMDDALSNYNGIVQVTAAKGQDVSEAREAIPRGGTHMPAYDNRPLERDRLMQGTLIDQLNDVSSLLNAIRNNAASRINTIGKWRDFIKPLQGGVLSRIITTLGGDSISLEAILEQADQGIGYHPADREQIERGLGTLYGRIINDLSHPPNDSRNGGRDSDDAHIRYALLRLKDYAANPRTFAGASDFFADGEFFKSVEVFTNNGETRYISIKDEIEELQRGLDTYLRTIVGALDMAPTRSS